MSAAADSNGLVRADPPELALARVLGVRPGLVQQLLVAATVHGRHRGTGLGVLAQRDRAGIRRATHDPDPAATAAAYLFR